VFAIPALVEPRGVGLKHAFEQSVRREEDLDIQALDAAAGIENFVQAAYGLTETDKQEVRNQFGLPVAPSLRMKRITFLSLRGSSSQGCLEQW